ncbi:hypothetical protein PUR71_13050 [Streptomyces sp. SP17BM10]|uniref:hypothetical protein n=1 Tax=Streptomyces sp. SP17BM10 TaxID=3002530 RepID=UPI002E783DCA|nr:hypothetical protein [Streptomyces sp. SP17BM10]MEE1783828.1 hypothetical protein [Streptomyces sp. SP17BM10]
MVTRAAGLVLAAAAAVGAVAAPASAAVKPVCLTEVNHPCAWLLNTPQGVVGGGLIDADDPGRLMLLRVEVKAERAWGSPWETMAAVFGVRTGSIRLTTPAVVTGYRTMVCVTGGPADDPEAQTTACRF